MRGRIVGFRMTSDGYRNVQAIIEIEGVTSRGRAAVYLGRKVIWRHPRTGTEIRGKIVRLHGKKGRVIAKFRRGLPGQALKSFVDIL
ncbi:MAG: 50S ribosomal protein L35ae [Thermoprotei archaeon]|nr:MAG: 50S ribosomal protein L35ae [Thermoprotei archaeon]HDD63805.1 50S ribosomal protein L35ae [Thermoprotei archaeon]